MTGPETTTTTTGASRDGQPSTATYDVAIIGAGYVGVPHAQVFAEAGRRVVLVDVDAAASRSSAGARATSRTSRRRPSRGSYPTGVLTATTDYDVVRDADAIVIALPTPLSRQREPDLSIVLAAGDEIGRRLRPGQLVVLESTTYPGTTRDALLPVLEQASGMVAGKDFHLAFAPERVDPGRVDWTTKNVPKVVGGIDEASTEAAAALYESAIDTVHRVSSPEAAELTKLLENIFRSVNIALVNELAQLCDRMGIDIWEVVDAAATKPFGFMPFQPGTRPRGSLHPDRPLLPHVEGPGVRLPDPVHRAGRRGQPEHAVLLPLARLAGAQPRRAEVASGSSVLVLGVAYKADISDWRESPAVKLIELLQNAGASVAYHDPHVPAFTTDGIALESVPFAPADYDAVVIATAHSGIDYAKLVADAQLVVDLRNATGRAGVTSDKVWKL